MINYYLLTKPGIILGNLITVAAGFLLASKGSFYPALFFYTLLGITLVMASACVFNNYIDRNVDQLMVRTKNRPLVTGIISEYKAILFGAALGILGAVTLGFYTNILTLAIACIGFFVYVILYSLWKCRTIYGTAIGSIAGAVPPVVGYCSVSNSFDGGALIFFLMLILWQMPHFFSISLFHIDDYAAAKIPVLPVKKGMHRTKVHMLLYILGFTLVATLLTLFQYTGYVVLAVTWGLGAVWFWLCIQGFTKQDTKHWSRQMFQLSLLIIGSICLVIPFDIA